MPLHPNTSSKVILFLKSYAIVGILLFLACFFTGSLYIGAFFERTYLLAVQSEALNNESLISRTQIYKRDREWVKQAPADAVVKRAVEILDTDGNLVACIVSMRMLRDLPAQAVSPELRIRVSRMLIRQILTENARLRSQSTLVPFPTNEWRSVAQLSALLSELENCKDAKALLSIADKIKDVDMRFSSHDAIESAIKWTVDANMT